MQGECNSTDDNFNTSMNDVTEYQSDADDVYIPDEISTDTSIQDYNLRPRKRIIHYREKEEN